MATKRPALDASMVSSLAKANKAGNQAKATKGTKAQQGETLTTSLNILRSDWDLLRKVAAAKAFKTGERISVSGVIADLIEGNRKDLQRQAAQ